MQIRAISSLLKYVGLCIKGKLRIFSSQELKSSLSEKYLGRLPQLTPDDICIYINNTYMIFHSDGGMSICNKYNVISSELLIADNREGYCESIDVIEPFEECDKELQPKVILDKFYTLK